MVTKFAFIGVSSQFILISTFQFSKKTSVMNTDTEKGSNRLLLYPFEKKPRFSIIFESDGSSYYFPGDKIKGNVILNLSKPSKIKKIQVLLKGYISIMNVKDEVFLNTYQNIFVNKMKKDQLQPAGTYVYPFEFDLPPDIPPSFQYSEYKIEYYCVAHIKGKEIKKIKEPFNIAIEYSKLNLIKVLSLVGTKERPLARSQDIKVVVKSKEYGFIGEPQLIHLTIMNEGKVPINEIQAKFFSIIHHHNMRKYRYINSTTFKKIYFSTNFKNVEGLPIEIGNIYKGKFEILIPENTLVTITKDQCQSIEVQNILSIKVLTKGNGLTRTYSKIDFELYVGIRRKRNTIKKKS